MRLIYCYLSARAKKKEHEDRFNNINMAHKREADATGMARRAFFFLTQPGAQWERYLMKDAMLLGNRTGREQGRYEMAGSKTCQSGSCVLTFVWQCRSAPKLFFHVPCPVCLCVCV